MRHLTLSFFFYLFSSLPLVLSPTLYSAESDLGIPCNSFLSAHLFSLANAARFIVEQDFKTTSPRNFAEYLPWQILTFQQRYGFAANIEKNLPLFIERRVLEIMKDRSEREFIGTLVLKDKEASGLTRSAFLKELFGFLSTKENFSDLVFAKRKSGRSFFAELIANEDRESVDTILKIIDNPALEFMVDTANLEKEKTDINGTNSSLGRPAFAQRAGDLAVTDTQREILTDLILANEKDSSLSRATVLRELFSFVATEKNFHAILFYTRETGKSLFEELVQIKDRDAVTEIVTLFGHETLSLIFKGRYIDSDEAEKLRLKRPNLALPSSWNAGLVREYFSNLKIYKVIENLAQMRQHELVKRDINELVDEIFSYLEYSSYPFYFIDNM